MFYFVFITIVALWVATATTQAATTDKLIQRSKQELNELLKTTETWSYQDESTVVLSRRGNDVVRGVMGDDILFMGVCTETVKTEGDKFTIGCVFDDDRVAGAKLSWGDLIILSGSSTSKTSRCFEGRGECDDDSVACCCQDKDQCSFVSVDNGELTATFTIEATGINKVDTIRQRYGLAVIYYSTDGSDQLSTYEITLNFEMVR